MTSFLRGYLPTHAQIYFGLLMVMAVSLPLSKALMSIVPGLLMLNWLIEGQFKTKLQWLKERRSVVLLISVFFVYLIGLLWTNSMKWGLHDLKIQLPLLILPLVIGTSAPLNSIQIKRVIYMFSAAVMVASFCSIWALLGLSGKQVHDPRDLSLFISHIRFALLINISIFSLGYYFFYPDKKKLTEKTLLGISIIWLSIFLIILKSATGWVVFPAVLSVIASYQIFRIKKLTMKIMIIGGLLFIFLLPLGYVIYVVSQFYTVQTIPESIATDRTVRGNPYSHDFSNKETENGNYTYLYINENELREAWNHRSSFPYDSASTAGFNRFVLVRYLTSKGLRKDAEGVEKLTGDDIRNIENGMTNYKFASSSGFFNRIYQVIWEVDVYRKGGNPSGHSVTQRIEYYKMAVQIIADKFWFGHGTGGYYEAYQNAYNQNHFFKDQQYRQRSHNMFLSYWIDFGLVGLLYICAALFSPVFMERKTRSYLLLVFLLIVLISFMNEDTLNNHDAISFFAFFYPLYLYSRYEQSEKK
jgi:Na+-transporting methylmalonyl-CoA/oxaloacetate decarboxylase gamma subunit